MYERIPFGDYNNRIKVNKKEKDNENMDSVPEGT